jgi:hypothetical protein
MLVRHMVLTSVIRVEFAHSNGAITASSAAASGAVLDDLKVPAPADKISYAETGGA